MQNGCIFASFRKYAFAEILRFRKYDFAGFRKLSREFANMVSQRFARIRKLSQSMVSQAFARIRQGFASAKIMVFRKDSQWALC